MLPFLAVLLAAVCFGTTGTAQAIGAPEASPLALGAARILIGGGILGVIALLGLLRARSRRRLDSIGGAGDRMPRRTAGVPSWLLVTVGALGVLAYQPAFFAGTRENGVAIGTVVALGSAPVITGLLDWVLNRRFPGLVWLGATAVATAGVVLISGVLGGAGGGVSVTGLAASVGAGAAYAVYTLASKALLDRGWSASGAMGAVFGGAAVLSIPVLLAAGTAWLATPAGLGSALWLGGVTTALAYLLFGWGLRRLSAPTVSTLTLAEPLTATLLGTLVLGETLGVMAIIGLIVLAAGLLLLTLGGLRRRPDPAPVPDPAPGARPAGAAAGSASS